MPATPHGDTPAEIERKITAFAEGAAMGVVEGVYQMGSLIMGEAMRDAPLDTGLLRGSAMLEIEVDHASMGTVFGGGFAGGGEAIQGAAKIAAKRAAASKGNVVVSAQISFNTPYAARQHEELNWRHPLGGHAKYLERPMLDLGDRAQNTIRAAALAGGVRALKAAGG